tara:strand:- start:8055 stop:8963 length:909 start_codon:yes stop_codon:yes gene_type:complete
MFGKREIVAMSVVNFIDNCRRDIQFYMKWIVNKDLRKEMIRNRTLKNLYKGKKCFIVGNGPSLKHHDLSKLTNEYVFTVNNMIATDYFKTLKPNFHLFLDPAFFDVFFHIDPKNIEEKEKMNSIRRSLGRDPNMIYFSSFRLKSTFTKLFSKLNSHYLFNNKIFSPHLKKTSEISRNTPAFQNVIIYAINIALYMGFKEIYLLGVDMTGFLEYYEYNKLNDQWGHFYDKSQEDQEKLMNFMNKNNIDNEFNLKNLGKTFQQFKTIQNYALRKKVKLFNASNQGALDVIPRVDYEKIFSKESV